MIIWSGRGFLVLLVLIALAIAAVALLPEVYQDYGIIGSIFSVAIFSWLCGKKWNGVSKEYIDKETGQTVNSRAKHSLFFINMEYWGIILGVLGLIGIVRLFI